MEPNLATVAWHVLLQQPVALFRELCRAHRLNRSRRHLLKNLASARGLANPVLVFAKPECFDIADLPPHLKTAAAELRQLRLQLFG